MRRQLATGKGGTEGEAVSAKATPIENLMLIGALAIIATGVYSMANQSRPEPEPVTVVVCESGNEIDVPSEDDPYLLKAYRCEELGTKRSVEVHIID